MNFKILPAKKKEPKHFELKKYEWLEYLKKNMDVCFFHKIQFMNGMIPAEVKPRLFAYTKYRVDVFSIESAVCLYLY